MKKVKVILSVIVVMVMLLMPLNVFATIQTYDNPYYGTITIDETPWTSENPVVTQSYYITKSTSKYVGFTIVPVLNTEDLSLTYNTSAFKKVAESKNSDGSITIILETLSGNVVSSKTQVIEAIAKFTGNAGDKCKISYSPVVFGKCGYIKETDTYFDSNGNVTTKENYTEVCEGTTPEPEIPDTPDTGSFIPYVALSGGLLVVVGLYIVSRKSNKVYKI